MNNTARTINEIFGESYQASLGQDYLTRFPIDDEVPSKAEIESWLEGHGKLDLLTVPQIPVLLKAVELAAAFSMERIHLRESRSPSSPSAIAKLVSAEMKDLKQEILICIAFDTKLNVIAKREIFRGTLNMSVVHPRDIFHFAIEMHADSIIIAHNHPSGNPDPSPEDRNATKQIKTAGELLQIKLRDHVIIGDCSFYSFAEEMAL